MPNTNIASFPYSPLSDSSLIVARDNSISTLTSNISSSTTTIQVQDNSVYNTPCIVVIDGEIIRAKDKDTSNNLIECDRGFDGTAASAHYTGTNVNGYLVAYHHNQIAAELKSISQFVVNTNLSGLIKQENLLSYSEQFEQSYWLKSSGVTILSNGDTSPNGSNSAKVLVDGNSYGINSISAAIASPVIGTSYCFSVFAKALSQPWLVLGQNIQSEPPRTAWFDLQNGVIQSAGNLSNASIVSIGSGWFRCIISFTCTSASYKLFDCAVADGNQDLHYIGTGTSALLLWGAQVRTGTISQSIPYLSTTGTPFSFTGGELILDLGGLS